jgi:hypothetical protein
MQGKFFFTCNRLESVDRVFIVEVAFRTGFLVTSPGLSMDIFSILHLRQICQRTAFYRECLKYHKERHVDTDDTDYTYVIYRE